MEPRQSDNAPEVGRQLSSSEWRVLHCLYSLSEGPDLVTAVSLRNRLASPPYNRDMRLNHVQVLLVRIEAAGYITSTPIPRGTGQPGRMEYSYRPRHAYEVVFDQLARSFLETLVIGSDNRAKAILRRLLEEEEPPLV
jgi:hypothetical protein